MGVDFLCLIAWEIPIQRGLFLWRPVFLQHPWSLRPRWSGQAHRWSARHFTSLVYHTSWTSVELSIQSKSSTLQIHFFSVLEYWLGCKIPLSTKSPALTSCHETLPSLSDWLPWTGSSKTVKVHLNLGWQYWSTRSADNLIFSVREVNLSRGRKSVACLFSQDSGFK